MTLRTKILGSLGFIIHCGCVAHCTFEYIGDLVLCAGPSMEPTIYSSNVLLTEHISPRIKRVERGDIIIAKCPHNPNQNICKRVKGLPGDRMITGLGTTEVVPKGHVWLEGDNYINSTDSRAYGPVPLGLIRSRALCRIWPLKDLGMLTV